MKRIIIVPLMLLLAFSASGYAQQRSKLSMSGVVTDLQSHDVIEGASVTVVGNQANPQTTDADGVFILNLAEGTKEIRIRVEKTGYRTVDRWVTVSSTIPLAIRLEPTTPRKTVVPRSPAPMPTPITKSDSFSVLVPFHGEWKNAPIPMNTNISDPHEDFYSALVQLGDRPDQHPEGWPPYRERKFESVDEQYHFITRLLQFYVFRSIYLLQRSVSGGVKWTAGVGVTPINRRAITPPAATQYAIEDVAGLSPSNEFLRPADQMLWKTKPLTMPSGTHVAFVEHEDPQKGEPFTCTVRLEKPGFFSIAFEIQPGIGVNNQLPAGFFSQAVQGTTTYSMTVSLKYEVQKKVEGGSKPDELVAWADSMFEALRKEMAFDNTPPPSTAQVSLESSFGIEGAADIADYPPNSVLSTISWKNEYSHVQLNLTNQESDDLSDVDLTIGTDESIAAIAQKTNFPDIVFFPPVADPVRSASLITTDKDGHQITIPATSTVFVTAPQYRIRCSKIYSHSTVQIAIALVTLNLKPGPEIRSPYAPKSLPKWLDVKGSYRIGQIVFNVDRHLEFKPNTAAPK